MTGGPGEFGVYVHIPFCERRCDYCAFSTYTDRDHLMERYVAACLAEIASATGAGELRPATSVFFGGGTPSRLTPESLCAIVAAIPLAPSVEITVECNPEDASAPRLRAYRDAGVNRISLGVQSTVPHVLSALGRHHDPRAVEAATEAIRASGIENWNADLIFGVAGESDKDWDRSLHDIVTHARPPHVSAYALTVEPGTPLARDLARHPDDDVSARRYERADEVLGAAGYVWEEVSNWAQPGHGCAHNALYWHQGDYRGIGAAAHSHEGGRRWWNVRTPERYIDAVMTGGSPLAGQEILSPDQRRFERLALALRTPHGVPDSVLPDAGQWGDLVERRDGRVVLTVAGRLVANELTARLELAEVPSR